MKWGRISEPRKLVNPRPGRVCVKNRVVASIKRFRAISIEPLDLANSRGSISPRRVSSCSDDFRDSAPHVEFGNGETFLFDVGSGSMENLGKKRQHDGIGSVERRLANPKSGPITAQMFKSIDNSRDNVAMLVTQFDWSRLEKKSRHKQKDQYLYTGISQFAKKLTENSNLINRVVWTVPSVPVNSDRFDDFSSQQGAVVPPSGGSAPIVIFSGRTTSFGDMYYVGLSSPAEGIDVGDDAKFLSGAGFGLVFPTATEDVTGNGRLSAGP